MSRRSDSKRGSKSKGGKPAKGPGGGREPRTRIAVFKPIKGGVKDFGAGTSEEYSFRRQYPLLDRDVDDIVEFSTRIIKRPGFRRRKQWVFISLLVKALGGLYEVKFSIIEGEETAKFELRWISTHTVKNVRYLRRAIVELLDVVIPFHLRERPAWILRIRVSSFTPSNPRGIGKTVWGMDRTK